MQANGGVLSIEQWYAITPEEFDEFRICGQKQVYDVQEVFFDVNYAHVTLEETALFDQKTHSQDEPNFLHDEVSKRAMCAHEVEDCAILPNTYLDILSTTASLFESGASDCVVDGRENKVEIVIATAADIAITTAACTVPTTITDTTFVAASCTRDITTDINLPTRL